MKSYVLLFFILYVVPIFPKIVYTVMCFHLSFDFRSTQRNHYKLFYLCYFQLIIQTQDLLTLVQFQNEFWFDLFDFLYDL